LSGQTGNEGPVGSAATPTRCFIGDSSPVFLRGLARLLISSGMSIAGEATTIARALERLHELDCDVVVLGFEPIDDAITVVMQVDLPTVILSSSPTAADMTKALKAGTKGFVSKDAPTIELIAAIRGVVEGRLEIGSEWAEALVHHFGISPEQAPPSALTRREQEIVQQLVEGRSNKQVGQSLGIAEQTVKNHLRNIMAKVGVPSRLALCRWAVEHHLGSPVGSESHPADG